MTPEIVLVVPALTVNVGSPVNPILLAMVRLPWNDRAVPAAIVKSPEPSALSLPTTSVPVLSTVPPE